MFIVFFKLNFPLFVEIACWVNGKDKDKKANVSLFFGYQNSFLYFFYFFIFFVYLTLIETMTMTMQAHCEGWLKVY